MWPFNRKKLSPLRFELQQLRANIRRTDAQLAEQAAEFWREGGVCCPSCGVPGYSETLLKQERREKQVKWIEAKLKT